MTEITRNPRSNLRESSSPIGETSFFMNSSQKMYLLVSCRHIDDLLEEIEEALQSETSKSPFRRYIIDMNATQIRVIEDYIHHLRTQLVRMLAWQHIDLIHTLLKKELESYSSALWQWMRQFSRRLELLISSYADGYRAEIQELGGHARPEADISKIKQDLELLQQWADSGTYSKETAQQIGA